MACAHTIRGLLYSIMRIVSAEELFLFRSRRWLGIHLNRRSTYKYIYFDQFKKVALILGWYAWVSACIACIACRDKEYDYAVHMAICVCAWLSCVNLSVFHLHQINVKNIIYDFSLLYSLLHIGCIRTVSPELCKLLIRT